MTSPSLTARPCLELVIYKIKNPADAAKARRAAQEAISRYDGFLSWAAWEGEDDPHLFADIAMWESLEAARALPTLPCGRALRPPGLPENGCAPIRISPV